MSDQQPAEMVEHLGDLDVVISTHRSRGGPRPIRIDVIDTRTRRALISLPPREAAALATVIGAKARRAAVVDDS